MGRFHSRSNRTWRPPEEMVAVEGGASLGYQMSVELRAIDSLRTNPRNARTHSKKQVAQIAASIQEFGFVNPVLIDENCMIVAGHGRVAAADMLGMTTVPTILLTHLTPEQVRAYVLADNRLAELAGWDKDILRIELGELIELDLDFDIEITGFATVDIDKMLSPAEDSVADPADTIPEPAEQAVSRVGDLWELGPHRLLCGNALDPDCYAVLMADGVAQMVFTDPPYNVPIAGHVSGMGQTQHREFVMAAGEMSSEGFTGFLKNFMVNTAHHCADGAILYVCMDWRHCSELLQAAQTAGLEQRNLCIWVKDNGGMGSFYRSQHELVFVFKAGTAPHINNFGLGGDGRYRTNVWSYPGVNTFRQGRNEELAMHPTVKPVALVADAIKDCSKRGGVILDPFAGSGTTIIAGAKTGRIVRALELDPLYVDVIIRRWTAWSGKPAVLTGSDRTFEQVMADRMAEAE
jgi:DNA modification methylase